MKRILYLTLVILAFWAWTADAVQVRLTDLGQGHAPGLMVHSPMKLGFIDPSFGFQHECRGQDTKEGKYYPWMDFTMKNVDDEGNGYYGIIGSNFDWDPIIGAGFVISSGPLSAWFQYAWAFDKGNELEYSEVRDKEGLSISIVGEFF